MNATNIDAGEHIPLIRRVIGQMGLRSDMADEAFSEGLVSIVEAARTYDPERQVPLANWLAKNIKWSIQNWISKQHPTINLDATSKEHEETERLHFQVELKEALETAQKILTPEERRVILAIAIGYKGVEIAKVMGISAVDVSRIKNRAQKKMREA